MPRDRGRGGHLGAYQVRTPARALATFEVAVRGRRAALTRRELVVVHPEAHRAARIAPLETRVLEDAIEPFLLRLGLHEARARHHERELHVLRHALAAYDGGGRTKVLDARVRARADEDLVDPDVG